MVAALFGTLIAPTAIVTGLSYYFGWIRTQAFFDHFGVSTSLLDYSPADYVLRSGEITFGVLICVAFAALILAGLHRYVVLRVIETSKKSRAWWVIQWFAVTAHVVGVALAIVVVAALLAPDKIGKPLGLIVPLLLIASVTLLSYVTRLSSMYPQELAVTPVDQEVEKIEEQDLALETTPQVDANADNEQRRRRRLLCVLNRLRGTGPPLRRESHPWAWIGVMVALSFGITWAAALYAHQVGTDFATRFVNELPKHTRIVLYSTERVVIGGPGVDVAPIVQPGSKYHYQYTGLRLLARSANRYILIPAHWQRGHDRVFIVRDDESIRIDMIAQ